jgi:hypothetical protein
MNICINYWGKPRKLNVIEETYNTQLNDKINNFHICYTTWKTEDISRFKEIFPDSYVNQIDPPDLDTDKYKYIIDNFRPVSYNPSIINSILGLYVRQQSVSTVSTFEQNLNIKFDFVITVRPDTLITEGILYENYPFIKKNLNYIYVGDRPRFDVLNMGSVPDSLIVSTLENTTKMLGEFPDFDKIDINRTYHPETASDKLIKLSGVECFFLNLSAFIFDHLGRPEFT